jgi:hypothetical protein
MNILSIQSHVAYGHVGNAAATFPLQRLGVEVWPIHTVQFSNHPGYGFFRDELIAAAFVQELIRSDAAVVAGTDPEQRDHRKDHAEAIGHLAHARTVEDRVRPKRSIHIV